MSKDVTFFIKFFGAAVFTLATSFLLADLFVG